MSKTPNQHIVIWGTYDASKSRTKALLDILSNTPDLTVSTIHTNVWQHKTQDISRTSVGRYILFLLHIIISYPLLIIKYLYAPKHQQVLVLYPGWWDVIILWPFAKLRRATITFDMFISLYDSYVFDRKLVLNKPLKYAIKKCEIFACKLANKVVLDTNAHCDYIADLLNIDRQKFYYAFVGAPSFFHPKTAPSPQENTPKTILFYGNMIPLQGVDVIIDAAFLAQNEDMHWHIIGSGQQDFILDNKICADMAHITHTPRVAYQELPALIAQADICLGIFGHSRKAHNVIPHKVYECLAMGKLVVTMNSLAIQEIYPSVQHLLYVLDNPSPTTLLATIKTLLQTPLTQKDPVTFDGVIVKQWHEILQIA